MHRMLLVLCWLVLMSPASIDGGSEPGNAAFLPRPVGLSAAADTRIGDDVFSRPLGKANAASAGADCPELDLPVPENSTWAWRLRTYRYLDCVTAIVDHALGNTPASSAAPGVEPGRASGEDAVRISRAELDRIRNLAWWARDAAARIGN